VQALDAVDFTVRAGEVHALMGENGAGKSTLIKVLTGVHRRDGGQVRIDGREIEPRTPREAGELGISTVYQEVNLIPHLSVAENVCLGREPTHLGRIRWREVTRRAREALARVDLDLDPRRELSSCPIAVQQMVAIARALDVDARLLILDEPTSSLDADEVEELFALLRRLRERGLGIVFVTHFLDQVYAISDRITVLRDGRLVGEWETARLPRVELVSRMVGKQLAEQPVAADAGAPQAAQEERPLLAARGLARRGSIQPFDLDVSPGRVVGVAGLLGSGRSELVRLLFGADRADAGELRVDGARTALRSPRQAIRLGFGYTPENRKVDGIIPTLSVRENVVLALQGRRGAWRRLPLREQEQVATRFVQALGIKVSGLEQPVGTLSGGNQQKVLLARWLATAPRLLILDEPTRGIDVGARAEIERLIAELGAEGMAVLLVSSELEEIVRVAGSVVVLRDRAKVAELFGEQVDVDTILRAIAKHDDAD